MTTQNPCPCCSGLSYGDCCAPFLHGQLNAPTAEQLMRSRYTAYTMDRQDYLLTTWHESTRPDRLELKAEPLMWLRLEILNREAGLVGDTEGVVEFVAHYKLNGKAHRLHEASRFVIEQGRWFYVSAI